MKTETLEIKTDQDYFAIDRLSNSRMSDFKRSPRHYLYAISNPTPSTPAMEFGSAFHMAILEPDKFESQYVTSPKCDMRTTIGKETWKTFAEANIGKTCISEPDMACLKRMKESLMAYAPARELIDQITEAEKPILWKDPLTGVELKGKLDGIGKNFILDLKTCQDANPANFASHAFNYDYHRQAALYLDGLKATGTIANNFYFIAIEKDAPHCVSLNRASDAFIEKGRSDYKAILENFRYWNELGRPDVGYEFANPFNDFDMNLPNWVK